MIAPARTERRRAAPDAPARCGPDPSILRAIHRPEVALAVWTRANPCPQAIEPAAEIDTQLPAGCGPDALATLLAGAGYRTSVSALAADLALHLQTMAGLTAAPWLRLRLDR
jgi:hypothetical protein